ncbi:hypothetical protein [Streptobacillus moniliformis]|nr:hypothetical protein [Streptobacillus moniliformis]
MKKLNKIVEEFKKMTLKEKAETIFYIVTAITTLIEVILKIFN